MMNKAEQREMELLRRQVSELTQALANATVGDGLPWSNAHVPDPRGKHGYEYAAAPHRSVRFYESDEAARAGRRYFDIRLGNIGSLKSEAGPQLLVMTDGQMLVLPHSSNVVAIEMACR
jgi:hypothetical protein